MVFLVLLSIYCFHSCFLLYIFLSFYIHIFTSTDHIFFYFLFFVCICSRTCALHEDLHFCYKWKYVCEIWKRYLSVFCALTTPTVVNLANKGNKVWGSSKKYSKSSKKKKIQVSTGFQKKQIRTVHKCFNYNKTDITNFITSNWSSSIHTLNLFHLSNNKVKKIKNL